MTGEQSVAAAAFARQRAAMAVEGIETSDKAILLVLAIMANADGQAWPSITQLSARASVCRRATFLALDRLEAAGLIGRAVTPGKGTVYSLPPDWCNRCTGAADAPVHQAHLTGATDAPKQPVNNHRRKKTSSSPSARARVEIDPADLPAGASEQQWADYAAMRVEMARGAKGRPWTAGAARKAIEKLHALAASGHAAGAVLDQSVLNGWQGLFPLKDDDDGRGRQHLAPQHTTRGARPDPALDLLLAARAELAEESAREDQGADRGAWPALPSYGDN